MIAGTPFRYIQPGEYTVCDVEFDSDRPNLTVRCKDSDGNYRVYTGRSSYLYKEFKALALKSGDAFHVHPYYHQSQRRLHVW